MKKSFIKAISAILVVIMLLCSAPLEGVIGLKLPGFGIGDRLSQEVNAASVSDLWFDVNEDGKTYAVTGCANAAKGKITIPSEYNGYPVTTIGSCAFSGCSKLTGITIPSSITAIEEWAFEGCSGLTKITIPNSVKSIGKYAFCNCASLSSITIGSGVTSIGENAFTGTTYYNNHDKWQNGVLYIGNYLLDAEFDLSGSYTLKAATKCIANEAFQGCFDLTSLTVSSSSQYYATKGGVLFNKAMTQLILCPSGKSGAYTVPDGVTAISDKAFYNAIGLTSVVIPSGVVKIGSGAFENCSKITSVTLPYGVKAINDSTFRNCRSLKNITIPKSVRTIGDYAFYYCDSLSCVTIPQNVKTIGEAAFYGCTELNEITVPDSLEEIGGNAFEYTAFIKDESNWENNVLYIGKILVKAKDTVTDTYNIKAGTVSISANAFNSCKKMTKTVIPSGVKIIGYCAFRGCTGLTSITIPDSVTQLGAGAFTDCKNIETVYMPGEVYDAYGSSSDAFDGCSVKTLVLSKGVGSNTIDGNFGYPNSLEKITLKSNVKYIDDYAFESCVNVKSITVPNSVERIGWQTNAPRLIVNRKNLVYPYYAANGTLTKKKTGFAFSNGYTDSYFSSITSEDPVTLVSSKGDIYALCGLYNSKVSLVSKSTGKAVSISEKGFTCGAGTIGGDNMLYLLWAKDVTDATFDKSPGTRNVKVKKYSLSGQLKGEYGFQLKKTFSMLPYDAGNASLTYNNGMLCVLWNTEWNGQYTNDGLHHQGMEFAILRTSDMKCLELVTNSGSHSFGMYAIKSDRGFAVAQLGDAFDTRGLNFFEYDIDKKESSYGPVVVFSSPGQYGSNAQHLDGNHTYISDIGVAESRSTFAFCAYGTDVYTTNVFMNTSLSKKAKYNVYVRILDKTLANNSANGCSGTTRKNSATGKVADYNVIKLTDLPADYIVNNLKIVTLANGAYCVLWNQNKRGSNPVMYYAVLNEKGYYLKKATKVSGGVMSDYNVPPIVQKNNVIWAVNDNGKLSWNTLNLKSSKIKADEIKTNSVKFTWQKTSGAKYYKVEQSTDGKTWKVLKTVSTNTLTVSSLSAGKKYQFRVTPLDSAKKKIGTTTLTLSTATLTKAPAISSLKSAKSKTATVTWKKVTGASKYAVYKSTDGQKWTRAATTTKLTYDLTKLTGGKKIYVKVTALNAYSRASAASAVKYVTVKK